jgi:hypothetical protein
MATRKQYHAPKAFAVLIEKGNKKKGTLPVKHYVAGLLTPLDHKKLGKDTVAKLVADGRVVESTVKDEDAGESSTTSGRGGKATSSAKSGAPAATS